MRKIAAMALAILFVLCLCGCALGGGETSETPGGASPTEAALKILVSAGDAAILYELNDSPAARALYAQLPLTLEVGDYGANEKIFYPPQALDVTGTPAAEGGGPGALAYYAPWGDVVLFYADFRAAGGLYALGGAVSGAEWIQTLSGTIEITAVEAE